jgi:chromosome segregation ATPase
MTDARVERQAQITTKELEGALEKIEVLESNLSGLKAMIRYAKREDCEINTAITSLEAVLEITQNVHDRYSALTALRDNLRNAIESLNTIKRLIGYLD